MALPDTINQLPNWSRKDQNRWADFIELSCLKNRDNYLTVQDIIDHFDDESQDDMEKGTENHSPNFDKLQKEVEDYFLLLEFRSENLKEQYPFEIGESKEISLKKTLNENHYFYIFLLISSNLSFFKNKIHVLTHAFEDISCFILRAISSPLATTHVFGTSRTVSEALYEGNLRNRVNQLAKNLGSFTTKIFDQDEKYDVPGGDGGLDLVSFTGLDDTPFIPFSFAQCACSYEEWEEKQSSIKPERWDKRIHNLAPYLQYTFVPFYFRKANGRFLTDTSISTSLIDRHRILLIVRNDNTAIKEFIKHTIFDTVKSMLH